MVLAPSSERIVRVDLGKTSSRAVVNGKDGRQYAATLAGVAASSDGGAGAAARIIETIALLPGQLIAGAAACGIGAAGLLTDPDAARLIARAVNSEYRFPVAAASDIITAHVGAFGGTPGVALVVGTGAVAVGLSSTGDLRRIDGWGPDIGDLGSGSWIGREGCRAVLAAGCGLGSPTALTARFEETTGGEDPVRWVGGAENSAQQLARLAPAVLDEAGNGDAVALSIADAALTLLGATAAAATFNDPRVAALGGLTQHPWFAARLRDELARRRLEMTAPAGDALAGAALIATRTGLPHERHIHRA
ncbi:N-acetylglucosamine kinase [Specibacter sp. RAF43]